MTKQADEAKIIARLAKTPTEARVPLLVSWLRAGLQSDETLRQTVAATQTKKPATAAPASVEVHKPADAQPEPQAPVSVAPTTTGQDQTAPAQDSTTKPEIDPEQVPDSAAVPNDSYVHHGLDEIDPSLFDDTESDVEEAHPAPRSKWAEMASNYFGSQDDPDVYAPQDALTEMVRTREYENFATFWDAFAHFHAQHHEATFVLSPVDVILMLNRKPPTALHIMVGDEWDTYEEFKAKHPEFEYA